MRSTFLYVLVVSNSKTISSSFILKVKAAEITPTGKFECILCDVSCSTVPSVSDQYHLGFTMRFPRALSIRDDLSIADCMTATGIMIGSLRIFLVSDATVAAVLESMKTERKRKMENKDT